MWTYYVVVDVIICNHEEVKIEPKKKKKELCPSLILWRLNLHHNNDQLFSK